MMQRQTIVEKPPWWKPRTGRGLMVIAPCLIALCVALAIGTAVIVSRSHSSGTSDSDTEVLPSEPEALVWKYFWRKLHKKMETTRIAVQAWPDAHRPVTKKTERNKPKLDVATTAPIRPHVIGTVTKRIETTKLNQEATTNGATRPHVIGTVTKRIETTKPNQEATSNGATRPHVIGTVTKRIETTKPNQEATSNGATRPRVIGTVTKRIETTKPNQEATTNGATRPRVIGTVTKRIETTKPNQEATTNGATRPRVIGTVTQRIETTKPNQEATTNGATRPRVIGTVTKRIETTKPKQEATTNGATRTRVIGTVTKRIETTKPKQEATTNGATRPRVIGTVTKRIETTKPNQEATTNGATRPRVIGTVTKRIETTKPNQEATTNGATRPRVIGTVTKRIETTKPKQEATTNGATRTRVIGTVTKRIETTKPKQEATTNGATRPRVIGTVTKRIETTKPNQEATTNGATRPRVIGTVTKRIETTKPKQEATTNGATRTRVIETVTKRIETTKPKQEATTNGATRTRVIETVTKRIETTKPKEDATTNGATRPDEIATTPEPKNTWYSCNTDICHDAASGIISKMDLNADPCDDFYQYACGGFLTHTVIPMGEEGVSASTVAEDEFQSQLKDALATFRSDEPIFSKLAKTLYRSCMNTGIIESKGINPLLSILDTLSKEAPSNVSDWQFITYKLEELGYSVNYLIKAEVDVDVENNTAHVIYLDQPDLGIPRAFLIDPDTQVREYYRQYMMAIGRIFNFTLNLQNSVDEILSFETKLAEISSPEIEHLLDPRLYHRTTLGKLTGNDKYPDLSWLLTYFEKVSSVDIDKDEVVIVKSKKYFHKLGKLLSTTDDKILANYIFWRAFMDSSIYMNDQIRNETLTFKQHLTGVVAQQPRWRECVDVVANKLPLSAYKIYSQEYDDDPAYRHDLHIFLNIYIESLDEALKKDDGTNDIIKGIARMKKATLLTKVMNPSRGEIHTFEKLYNWHTFSEDDYLVNGLKATLLTRRYMFDNLRKPVPKFDWVAPRDGILTKVRYSKSKNIIDVPISFILRPFFYYEGSERMNYCASGFILSREFAHAFDNSGRRYDQQGNIIKAANETIDEEYENLSNCIINKYGNYNSKSANLEANARIMQNEIFADMAGLKLAYSMNKWIRILKWDSQLPVIDGNPNKLFWISAAQTLCSKYNPQAEAFKINTEAYFPDRFRVLGAMSNMPEFSDDFSCPAGSPMNPKEKCTLW